MKTKDRDNFFFSMAMWQFIKEWKEDKSSDIDVKERKKLELIETTLLHLFTSFRKKEGEVIFKKLLDKVGEYHFAMLPINKDFEGLTGTFEETIVKETIRGVVDKSFDCITCVESKDFKSCGMFALRNLLSNEKNGNCKKCPYLESFF